MAGESMTGKTTVGECAAAHAVRRKPVHGTAARIKASTAHAETAARMESADRRPATTHAEGGRATTHVETTDGTAHVHTAQATAHVHTAAAATAAAERERVAGRHT